MEISEQKQQEIKEQALLMGECLKQMNANIPKGLKAKDLKLGPDELQSMATSIYITVNGGKDRNGNGGKGNYEGKITHSQKDLISTLEKEIDELTEAGEGYAIIKQFLDDNGRKSLEELTKSEASSLCTGLIDFKKEAKEEAEGAK